MFFYKELVDRILESEDYVKVLREVKNFYIKTFDDFVKQLQDFDNRLNKKGIKTVLTVNKDAGTVDWYVEHSYGNDKVSNLVINSFEDGQVECDKTKHFATPAARNLNELKDANKILKFLDGYLYALERDDPKEQPKDEKEDEEEKFNLDPSITKMLDDLKVKGEDVIKKFKSVPPFEYNGKKYKVEDGKLMASTERELIANLEFPAEIETVLYDNSLAGKQLRSFISRYYRKNGVSGFAPEFRKDMDKGLYFYVPIGKLPVRKPTGDEAMAILNYYDGNKVRFQPRSDDF